MKARLAPLPKGARSFADIESALRQIRAGKMVVVVDDEDRENEGDFVMAAERATAEDVNFMASEARGLICVSMPACRLESLGLSLMAPINTARFSHSVHRLGRSRCAAPPPALPPTTARSRSARWRTGRRSRKSWPGRATYSRYAPRTKASSAAPGTPKPRSTWFASPGSPPRASSARFSRRTEGWRTAGSSCASPDATS